MVPDGQVGAASERVRTEGHPRTSEALPIVALCRDWEGDTLPSHHILRELAKTRRVVWLNTDGNARGLRRKLRDVARGPVRVENDLWVATPIALPHGRLTRTLDRWLVESFVRAVRARLGILEFELWTFVPDVADYLGMGESLAVYYCTDEHSMHPTVDREAVLAAERRLLERVDCVFASSHPLADVKREICPTTFVVPHGVDHALFASALGPTIEIPADIATLPRPVIGAVGSIGEHVDLELIAQLARLRPRWSIVMIGPSHVDTTVLRDLYNVRLLGPRALHELPAYLAGFDVGLIPYRTVERMAYVNPLKLREYLAAGLPVVSTAVAEVERYPGLCQIARTPNQLASAIEHAVVTDSPAVRAARSAVMRDESWEARIDVIQHEAAEVAERRSEII